RFGSPLLFGSRTREDVRQAVVAFVTRVLEERPNGFRPGHFGRPWPRPRRRIVDRELISDRVLVHAREALDQVQVLTGPLERVLAVEIRRFDDERVPFPTPAIAAGPLPNGRWKLRTPIERDDAD